MLIDIRTRNDSQGSWLVGSVIEHESTRKLRMFVKYID